MITIARFTLREALRRRIFTVVGLLTGAFLVLYALGAWQAFESADEFGAGVGGVDPRELTGATILGLAMFGTLFLGAILAVFLTLGAVRGDAERGLLQPLLVRPVPRRQLLLARLIAAGAVAGGYTAAVFAATLVITSIAGDGWWPDRVLRPGGGLVLGVIVLAALSLAGSVVLAAAANGIATFMVFGAGLTAGLLGQIGEALGSETLDTTADIATWLLPFEALYQSGLSALTADTGGVTGVAISLGPFGGAEPAGWFLWPYTLAYLAAVTWLAIKAFERADL